MKLLKNSQAFRFLIVLLVALVGLSEAHGMKQRKSKCLSQLSELQKKQVGELKALDRKITEIVSSSQSFDMKSINSSGKEIKSRFDQWEGNLTGLIQRRKELMLRRDFVDRMIFQIDSKWSDRYETRPFLIKTLRQMSVVEMSQKKPDASMWRFLSYLSIALKEIPSPNENLFEFIESYLNFSSISKPKPPFAFLEHRHYTSGALAAKATEVPIEEVGLALEKRLEELKQKQMKAIQGSNSLPLSPLVKDDNASKMRDSLKNSKSLSTDSDEKQSDYE